MERAGRQRPRAKRDDISASADYSVLERWGRSRYLKITLDDLPSTETRFRKLYKELVPGSQLEITFAVSSKNMLVDPSAPIRTSCNSLFADAGNVSEAGGTAVITCARHLQKLDESSGVDALIIAAKQNANLDFSNDTLNKEDTYRIYPLPSAAVNGAPAGGAFYQEATVKRDGNETVFQFNPHFARTVDASGKQAFVRSPRQLYSLSRFYDNYRAETKEWTFSQRRDIIYTEWHR